MLALIDGDCSLTYPALEQRVDAMHAALHALGVVAGARVGILAPSSAPAVAALHALWRIGATPVMLNTRLTAHELSPQVLRARCSILLDSSETATLAAGITSPDIRCVSLEALYAHSATGVRSATARADADLAALMFTSGTSGTPKAVMLTHGNLRASANASARRLGVRPDDRWLCALPLFHIGGLAIVHRSALYGTAIDLQRRFDLDAVRGALDKTPVTLVSLVPTMLKRLLDTGWRASSALRLILLGGAAATPELITAADGAPIATTYGLTEASSQAATALPAAVQRKPGSVGTALPGLALRIAASDGHSCSVDEPGEILIKGPTVMRGYLDDPEASARVLRDGWLHTGDIGYLDADGDLFVLQRRSDLIISGGENVYPAEVEAALRTHPNVVDVAVVGLPSAEWGQQVAALLVLADADQPLDAIRAHCRTRLAGYKQPRILRAVAALPLNAAGKVDRAAVQETLSAP
jgi:O-succinylbenzoic acid--CoA ligase